MNTSDPLFPHQRTLVEEFRSGSLPRVVAVEAPVGTGKTYTLITIATQRAAEGRLVIVVVPPSLVAQWAARVNDINTSPATVYASPSDFRLAFDTDAVPWPEAGIVICGSSVIRAPLAAKTLSDVAPSLLIVDEVNVSAGSDLGRSLRALADRAGQVIFTGARENTWLPAHEVRRWEYPLIDSLGRRIAPQLSARVHDYAGDPVEAEVMYEAVDILRRAGYPLPEVLLTRSAIQFALLRLAQRLDVPEQLLLLREDLKEPPQEEAWSPALDHGTIEEIWILLDHFDDLPPDRRLSAVIEETRSAREEERPVVIVTDLAQEVDYIVAAIKASQLPVSRVTGVTTLAGRLAAAGSLRDGGVLVATPEFFADIQRPLPSGTRNVWYTPPRTQHQLQQRLGFGMSSAGIEIVLLKATPPVTQADELVDEVEAMLRNPWQEQEGRLIK